MNGRQAAKAAAKRITELEYVNAMQAQDIKDYHKVIWDMIAGESPCTYCESFEECQREVKAGKGCQEWWLRFRKDGDPDGQETGTGTDSVLSVAEQ